MSRLPVILAHESNRLGESPEEEPRISRTRSSKSCWLPRNGKRKLRTLSCLDVRLGSCSANKSKAGAMKRQNIQPQSLGGGQGLCSTGVTSTRFEAYSF